MDSYPTQYQNAVLEVLENGTYEKNRTGVDTIADFGVNYNIDVANGFPLLTTKQMDTFRWDSMLSEFAWYLSGEHHIRDLKEETKIWNAWADEDWNLPTAYGRFWRRFPVPSEAQHKPGEWWLNSRHLPELAADHYDDVSEDEVREMVDRWMNDDGTMDQIAYAVDTLNGENPLRPPESRRIIITAWHPGNATVSHLPPCHFEYVATLQDGKLNVHLTQRSADLALGVPFNIAAYALMTRVLSRATGHEIGEFSHTLVSAHAYCGKNERGEWYRDNLSEIQERVASASTPSDYRSIREYILENAPEERDEIDPSSDEYGYDHVPGLLEQLGREPYEKPTLSLDMEEGSGLEGIDSLEPEDIQLSEYDSHGGLRFNVAE